MTMPRIGDIEYVPHGYHRADLIPCFLKVVGTGTRNFEHHIRARHQKIACTIPFEQRVAALTQWQFGAVAASSDRVSSTQALLTPEGDYLITHQLWLREGEKQGEMRLSKRRLRFFEG
jgi:hypothetical protein